MLESLSDIQRERLVSAMAEVERLLTATLIQVDVVDPADARATYCLGEYFAELDARFDTGFDPADSLPADSQDDAPPAGLFLLATLRDEPVGCGALKFHGAPAGRAEADVGVDERKRSRSRPTVARRTRAPCG